MMDNQVRFHSSNGKRLVLVVDDEAINREIIGDILKEDYEVLFAEDGREALKLMRQYKDVLSLVLLDLMMPVMSGTSLLKMIKEDDKLQKIPVIVVTSDQTAEIESLELGAIDFIPKPYPKPGVILARVLRVIELSEDREIIHSTERDPVTGLYNKDYFYRYADQFDQYHQEMKMDAIVLDVNHFHMVNERYGKAYGNEVLRRIGKILRELSGGSDSIVCRKESDTFLVYCKHGLDHPTLLEKAMQMLNEDQTGGNSRLHLRMGVYADVDKDLDMERRFDRAKQAADTVRHSFSKNLGIYDQKLHQNVMNEEQLIEDFHGAIEKGQFQVYYQPKFDISREDPELSSAEALIRWNHPERGLISPGLFIPLFEKNGLIQKLDRFVWEETAKQLRDWKRRYGYTIPVSVNISRIDMFDSELTDILCGIMEKYELKNSEFILEITESAYTDDAELIISTVKKLRTLGFSIEMDDFGTGYSSLGMISHLPIDALKLDMSFIRNAFSEKNDVRMLELIIDIADYLSVPVIAEGVETEEQMLALKEMGCDIAQGYYFSKPVPAAEFDRFMQEKHAGALKSTLPFSRIAQALSRDFFGIYYVDLETGEFIEYYASKEYQALNLESRGWDFFETCRQNLANVIFPGDRTLLENSLTKEQVVNELEKSGIFSLNYRLLLEDKPTWVRLKAVRLQPADEMRIVVGVENIDAHVLLKESYENAQKKDLSYSFIADILAKDYYSIYYVNLETDEFIEYSSNSEYKELQVEQNGVQFFDDCYRNVMRLVHPEDLEMALEIWLKENLVQNLKKNGTVSAIYRLMFEGIPRYINAKVIPLKDPQGVDHIVIGISNIDAQMRKEQEREKVLDRANSEPNRDALTGVKSKNAYVETEMNLNHKVATGEAEEFSIVVCDVNGLKQINDTLGHKAGDRYIKEACEEICHTFKHSPVFRVGGDVFAVILQGQDYMNREYLMTILDRLNRQHTKEGGVVMACGLADYVSGEDDNLAAVYERAERAMEKDKLRLKSQ